MGVQVLAWPLVVAMGLVLPYSICEATSLGAVVNVVPLEITGGNMVRAHYTVISALPCPTFSGVCQTGEDCVSYITPFPFTGQIPTPGWCVRQWQKTIPSNYTANVTLGSTVNVFLFLRAGPYNRSHSLRLNQPPFCSLPPPLRANVNCPHRFPLTVKDLDKDKVRCRFARPDLGECLDCPEYSFLKIEEGTCTLVYNGKSSAGQFSLKLMVEDFPRYPPLPINVASPKAFSSIPLHLSLTVEASSGCNAGPVTTGLTPAGGATIHVLPYEQINVVVTLKSELESVSEIVVVGPPDLFRTAMKTQGSLATMNLTWIRGPNNLPSLLPLCVMANSKSLQSEPRCIWLHQRQMETLPPGTELTCKKTEMNLVLPISTLKNLILSELQLNNPSCNVIFNSTHVTANISLTGCGTKIVHSGSDLVYTNTLQSVRNSVISRLPTLVLPLACRYPAIEAKGPQYAITIPSEQETFGIVKFWLEFYPPGVGPFANQTRAFNLKPPSQRRRRDTSVRTSNRLDTLDLHVFSNATLDRVELMVGSCMESETADMAESKYILDQGCNAGNGSLEVVTSSSNARVYQIDLSTVNTQVTTMYMECTVYLCVTLIPSQKCPDQCNMTSSNQVMVDSLLTRTYTVRSGPISLLSTSPGTSTTGGVASATITTIAAPTTRASDAAAEDPTMVVGLVLAAIHVLLQSLL
ncbi:uncharacterized protein LOC105014067 [Esox lucius]|uniref:uncharacterized protein LOC105014067 n=1 Tax=Esox lucius TaxID=8010 RepID=UPI0014771BFB|nr:uncharacterized protein LOC105014067 [Esox lucius]